MQLRVVHGQSSLQDATRKDEGTLPWTEKVHNRYLNVGGVYLTWQPLPKDLGDADLVILMQENKILSNYPQILRRRLLGKAVGFWGHGRNFQSIHPRGVREVWKRFVLRQVHWWFTYTDICVEYLVDSGVPRTKVTNLENAIDVRGFKGQLAGVSDKDVEWWRTELSLDPQARIGLFCGSMYAEKKIDCLLESAKAIKARLPSFVLVVVGDGPEARKVQSAAAGLGWIKVVGHRVGKDKATLYRLAHVILNPGAVGLHVLDAFVSGVPMVTTRTAMHGPEISYLQNGRNGVICETDDVDSYCTAAIRVIEDEDYRNALARAGVADGDHYTIENMARRFADGIVACLDQHMKKSSVSTFV